MKRNILLITFLLSLPLHASGTDDEIIKNLDFFQNLELIKKDNPYLVKTVASEKIEKETEKSPEKKK